MSLVQCPECSSQVSSNALMCVSCGFPISKSKVLSIAILLNDSQMVSDLIQLGADVNGLDENGQTPLSIAESTGNLQMLQILNGAATSGNSDLPIPTLDKEPALTEPVENKLFEDPKTEPILIQLVENEQQLPEQNQFKSSDLAKKAQKTEFKIEPAFLEALEDERLFRPKEVDGLSCLVCGGGIKPEQISCTHCKTLIVRRYCSHCSKLIPDHSTTCPLCGKNVKEHFLYSKLRRAKILIGTATVALSTLLLLLLMQQTNSQPTIAHQTAPKPVKLQEEITLPEPSEPVYVTATTPEPIQRKIKVPSAPKPQEKTEQIPVPKPDVIERLVVEPQSSNPPMSASTQRMLELREQQRIKRGRFLNNKGFSLIKEGLPSEAIPLLEQSIRSFPEGTKDVTYAYALFNLGVAYRMAGRPDIAIPILEERIKIDNQREVVQRELLVARRQAGKFGLVKNEYD